MILSDYSIRELLAKGDLIRGDIADDQIQPASVDVRFGNAVRIARTHFPFIDPYWVPTDLTELVTIEKGKPFVLHPGEFVLGHTIECVHLPDGIVARVDGKSSLGRLGILVHATAGFIDPGFEGEVTLELSNIARLPVLLWPGMKIAQLSFMELDCPAVRPYGHPELGSKYQFQRGPVASAQPHDGPTA